MIQKSTLIVLMLFYFSYKLTAQLSGRDSLLCDRLFMEAYTANNDSDYSLAILKIDSLITIALDKKDWYYGICAGLVWKSVFASHNNQLGDYYEGIRTVDYYLERHYEQMGECREITSINNQMHLGQYYKRRGSFNMAQDVLEHLLYSDLYTKMSNLQTTTLLLNLATVHKAKSNYQLALNYALECRDSFQLGPQLGFERGFGGLINKHIADIYAAMDNNVFAEDFYRKAKEIHQDINSSNRNIKNRIFNTYNAYANFYLDNDTPLKAIGLLQEVLEKQSSSKDPFREQTYRLIGEAYTQAGAYNQAMSSFKESIEANKYDLKNYQLAEALAARGKLYTQQNNYTAALEDYQKALINLKDDFDNTDICSNPEGLQQVNSIKTFIKVLHRKSEALFKQDEQLGCAWKTVQLAIKAIDYINEGVLNESDKQLVIKEYYDLFELAIEISLAQANGEGLPYAFEVSEKSKANNLMAAVRSTQVRDYYRVSQDSIDQEYQYKYEILKLEERKYEALQNGKDHSRFDTEIARRYGDLKNLKDFYYHNHPTYYNLRYNMEVDEVQTIQKRLGEKQLFVEYFMGERNSYAFWFTKTGDLQVTTICDASQTSDLVQEMLYAIYVPHVNSLTNFTPEEQKYLKAKYNNKDTYSSYVYAEYAHTLYQCLLEPILTNLDEDITRLEIIPDGMLNILPFDALLQKAVSSNLACSLRPDKYADSSSYRYLMLDYEISYCYSATLMGLMKNSISAAQQARLLVFHDLEFQAQINKIERTLSTFGWLRPFMYRLDEASTKDKLQALGNMYKYLHFSVHGTLNNKYPNRSYLRLRGDNTNTDSLLYLSNLYGMRLFSDLVVTTACNAGMGKFFKGEGLLSLARGFSYSGARSLVTSLWIINDGPSHRLMEDFYASLADGKQKDAAFTTAKREFIQQAPSNAHPYYWAAFVPIGNMDTIEMPMPRWKIYVGIGLALLLLLLVRFRKSLF